MPPSFSLPQSRPDEEVTLFETHFGDGFDKEPLGGQPQYRPDRKIPYGTKGVDDDDASLPKVRDDDEHLGLPSRRDERDATPVVGDPYRGRSPAAPFDAPFFFIFNVAVGEVGRGCPDPGYWSKPDPSGVATTAAWCEACAAAGNCTGAEGKYAFWQKRDDWWANWQQAGEGSAFAIDWVKVWQ